VVFLFICSGASPLYYIGYCSQATHRGWPFLELKVFASRAVSCHCSDRLELIAGQ